MQTSVVHSFYLGSFLIWLPRPHLTLVATMRAPRVAPRVGNLLDENNDNEVSASFVRLGLGLDPLADVFEPDHSGSGGGAIRLADSDSEPDDIDDTFWNRFVADDIDTDIAQEAENQGLVHYTSARTYRGLFDWEFQKHSFPSRQLARAKENGRPGVKRHPTSKEDLDPGVRAEIERFKLELRGELGDTGTTAAYQKKEKTDHRQTQEREQEEPLGDLLGEYNFESTCLLDLDLENEMGEGYTWRNGAVRDIETGRPVTPYKDDPARGTASASTSTSTRGSADSRGVARRSRPFPSRGRGGGRATPNGSAPVAGHILTPQTSTRSLPSVARGQTNGRGRGSASRHHHPSLPSQPMSSARAKRSSNPLSPYATLLSKPQARQNVPSELYQTASATELQRSMLHSWASTCAKPEYQQTILKLLEWMTETINMVLCRGAGHKGKARFEVDVFGSVSWGGETGSSGDLDLVIIVSHAPSGRSSQGAAADDAGSWASARMYVLVPMPMTFPMPADDPQIHQSCGVRLQDRHHLRETSRTSHIGRRLIYRACTTCTDSVVCCDRWA